MRSRLWIGEIASAGGGVELMRLQFNTGNICSSKLQSRGEERLRIKQEICDKRESRGTDR